MTFQKHPYREKLHGRSISSKQGVGGASIKAHVQCSRCPRIGEVGLTKVLPPEPIDQKFRQHGWKLDPHVCPDCQRKPKKGPDMATAATPAHSPAAMKAQGQMFHLLTLHFVPETGRYAKGWSDKKIADDTGLALDHVAAFRASCFGDLKESAEIAGMRADLDAAEALANENHKNLIGQIVAFRAELDRIARGA